MKRLRVVFSLVLVLFFGSNLSVASPIDCGEMYYDYLGGDSFRITLNAFYWRSSMPNSQDIKALDANTGQFLFDTEVYLDTFIDISNVASDTCYSFSYQSMNCPFEYGVRMASYSNIVHLSAYTNHCLIKFCFEESRMYYLFSNADQTSVRVETVLNHCISNISTTPRIKKHSCCCNLQSY